MYIPSAPHVHLRTIYGGPEEKLRWSIPEGDDAVSVVGATAFMVEASQTKVCKLQFATIVYQYIRALYVAMNDSFVMKIG